METYGVFSLTHSTNWSLLYPNWKQKLGSVGWSCFISLLYLEKTHCILTVKNGRTNYPALWNEAFRVMYKTTVDALMSYFPLEIIYMYFCYKGKAEALGCAETDECCSCFAETDSKVDLFWFCCVCLMEGGSKHQLSLQLYQLYSDVIETNS